MRQVLKKLRNTVEVLREKKEEERKNQDFLLRLRYGVSDQSGRGGRTIPGINWLRVNEVTTKYSPEVIDFATTLIHGGMTTYECLSIHKEIDDIPCDARAEFTAKVQQIAHEPTDYLTYSKIFGLIKRMPSPKWEILIEHIQSSKKQISRGMLAEIEETLEKKWANTPK